MKTIGRHLIAEFYGCSPDVLNSADTIRSSMLKAAEKIGATVVGDTFHQFSPQGVSGSVVIAESHLSIHTWPENGYVSVDIYTCGGLDPRLGFRVLSKELVASSMRVQEIIRGLPDDIAASEVLAPEDVSVITRMCDVTQAAEQSAA